MSVSILAYLSARRHEILGEFMRLLREHIPFYRSFPEERLRPAAGAVLDVFLDEALATWNVEPLLAFLTKVLLSRAKQGLSFEEALGVIIYLRRAMLSSVVSLIDARLEETPRFLIFIDEYSAMAILVVARVYTEALESAHKELREREARYREIVELSPDGMTVHREGRFLYLNPAGARMLGTEAASLLGKSVLLAFPPELRDGALEQIRAAAAEVGLGKPGEYVMMRADGSRFDAELIGAWITFEGSPARQVVFRDITERKQAEEALKRSAVQEEVIQAQEARLRELRTPLIPVSDGVVVMPLVGLIDEARAAQLKEVLLSGIAAARARVAILDVTGVPIMDASAAAALLSAVAAARLLGAEVVLTGIKPGAARALVELGAEFGRVVTRGTLKDGISYALAKAK